MTFNKILDISIKRIKQNRKRNLILIVPLCFLLIILFSINMIIYSVSSQIENIQNSIELRTINGISYNQQNYNQILENLQSIDHIQMIADQYEQKVIAVETCENLKNSFADGYIKIKPINTKTCPEVICGRKISEADRYVIILPSKIYADSNFRDYTNPISENEYINGETLLNKKISITFTPDNSNSFKKDFLVIGIYNSQKYNNTSTPYVPIQVIRELNKEINYIPNYFQLQITVDNISNVEETLRLLDEKNIISKNNLEKEAENTLANNISKTEYNISQSLNLSIETMEIIKKLIIFLFIISLIILLFVLLTTNINKSYLQTSELWILKVEGYTNKDIQKITIIENIFLCIISILISIIIFILLHYIINFAIENILQIDTLNIKINEIKEQIYYLSQIPQKIDPIFIIILSICVIIIESINTFIINHRILRNKNSIF